MTTPPTSQPHTAPETQVSGAVLDFQDFYRVHAGGWIESKRFPGQPLRPHTVKGGYQRVTITVDGCRVHRLLHVLVATVHLGPIPAGMQVNHKDGDKTNNAVTNLEYVTPKDNVRHALNVLGIQRARGQRVATARLTDATVRELRTRHAAGERVSELAHEYGVHECTAYRAINGSRWGHVA